MIRSNGTATWLHCDRQLRATRCPTVSGTARFDVYRMAVDAGWTITPTATFGEATVCCPQCRAELARNPDAPSILDRPRR